MLALSGYLTLLCIWSYFVFNFHLFAKLERTNSKILYTSSTKRHIRQQETSLFTNIVFGIQICNE